MFSGRDDIPRNMRPKIVVVKAIDGQPMETQMFFATLNLVALDFSQQVRDRQ